MKVVDAVLSQLPDTHEQVQDVLVGIHWTTVFSRSVGLASSLTGSAQHGEEKVRDVGSLHTKPVRELAEWARSDNLLEASIGMAAINSLLTVNESQAVEINAGDILAQRGRDKNIAVVGHFPFVRNLRTLAKQCWVLELRPAPGDLPAEAADEILPLADVIAITGTALINHTIDNLLKWCNPKAYVMVLGPSTPLTPVWYDFGVDVYSGTSVIDAEAVRRTVSQGAIFPQVKGVRLLSFSKGTV